jgi:hypothetical protein
MSLGIAIAVQGTYGFWVGTSDGMLESQRCASPPDISGQSADCPLAGGWVPVGGIYGHILVHIHNGCMTNWYDL